MKLSDVEQSLVIGNIIKNLYNLFEESEEKTKEDLPKKVIIFVDELNRFVPNNHSESSLVQKILDISERKRSPELILFSAQQFMSSVHSRIVGSTATKIIGRSCSSEILLPEYHFLDQDIRMLITRFKKGELLLSHPILRQPIKIIFPKPAYHRTR
jgi:DNA helicase HerA-like ATPase